MLAHQMELDRRITNSTGEFAAGRPERPQIVAASEKSLVAAAKQGEPTAFGKLCDRYTQQLMRATHRITRNREDAEDAVQDALMRAFVHIKDFDGRSGFATWLTRIAINSALMILRKKRGAQEVAIDGDNDSASGAATFELPDRAPSPERHYAQKEEARILRNAVQRLRPSLREVVMTQHLQERSMKETAQSMGISVAAAKARLFHAKAALRKSSLLRMSRQTRPFRRLPVLTAA